MSSSESDQIEFKFKYIQKKTAKQEKFDKCSKRFCSSLHWFTVFLITMASLFTGLNKPSKEAWDMSTNCEVAKFNMPVSRVDRTGALATITTLASGTLLMMSLRMFMYNKMSKDFMIIGNYFVGFLLCWDISYITQNIFAYPVPSFYTNDHLKWYYCCKECPPTKYDKNLEKLDMASRGSLPSFLICALSYATVYFYLFTCFLDHKRHYAAQLITLIIPGFVTAVYGWLLCSNNENHFEDVICGAFIGTFIAVYIMRDLLLEQRRSRRHTDDFVSVILARNMIEMREMNRVEIYENAVTATASESEFTINLDSYNENASSDYTQEPQPIDELPPPYSSL